MSTIFWYLSFMPLSSARCFKISMVKIRRPHPLPVLICWNTPFFVRSKAQEGQSVQQSAADSCQPDCVQLIDPALLLGSSMRLALITRRYALSAATLVNFSTAAVVRWSWPSCVLPDTVGGGGHIAPPDRSRCFTSLLLPMVFRITAGFSATHDISASHRRLRRSVSPIADVAFSGFWANPPGLVHCVMLFKRSSDARIRQTGVLELSRS